MKDLEKVYNANSLITAFKKCKKNTSWKEPVQRYEANLLLNTYRLQQSLVSGTYQQGPTNEFDIHERGKTRHIKAIGIADRVVQRSTCDNLLLPALRPLLIYDNGSSLENRGVGFTRGRLYTHLERYYDEFGTNAGYILLIDYSKYFDNIQHDVFLNDIKPYFSKEAYDFIVGLIKNFEIDVSYMSDEEYIGCLNMLFNSLEYEKIDKSLMTGKKFMRKSMGIGSQVSQVAGAFYPHKIDNYCKCVKSIRYYARYADDSYIISPDKNFLKQMLVEITEIAARIGITINPKKARIETLDKFEFLKLHYSLLPNGRVRVRTTNETFRRERRKLLKLSKKLSTGKISLKDIADGHRSWRGGVEKYGNHYRIKKCDDYFKKIFNIEV